MERLGEGGEKEREKENGSENAEEWMLLHSPKTNRKISSYDLPNFYPS